MQPGALRSVSRTCDSRVATTSLVKNDRVTSMQPSEDQTRNNRVVGRSRRRGLAGRGEWGAALRGVLERADAVRGEGKQWGSASGCGVTEPTGGKASNGRTGWRLQ